MGPAADVALATGAITALNELVFAPAAGGKVAFNWRVIPATAVFALIAEGISRLSPQMALGISVTALIVSLFTPLGSAGSPITNLDKLLGSKTA